MGTDDQQTHHHKYVGRQIERGLCRRASCKNPPVRDRRYCEYHLAKFARQTRKRIAGLRGKFLCADGGCSNPVEGKQWYCPEHQQKRYERQFRRYINATADPAVVEAFNKSHAIRRRARYDSLRAKVLNGYGGCCACCGENQSEFLTIDHVTGEGWREKTRVRKDVLYSRIITAGFPPSYQILCWNCNCAKKNDAHCPHELRVRELLRLA